MTSKIVISAIITMSLTTGGFAFAQGNDRNDRGRNEQEQRGSQQDRRDEARQQNRRDNEARQQQNRRDNEARQQQNRRDNEARQQQNRPQHQGYANERRDERGAGPNHAFHRGERLPAEYRNRHYVVDDWRGHQLSAPPRGYNWVQTGGDYVLVAIATGIIAQLLLNN